MKRKLHILESFSKRPRTVYNLRSKKTFWVNATDVKNFMINDHIVDWLKLVKKSDRTYNTKNLLFEKGIEFEKKIIENLNSKYPIVTISDKIDKQSCDKTIEYIKKGVPILHSVPFENNIDKTRGVIDLLVRNDYVRKLFNLDVEINIDKQPYYYIAIDIKFSTLPLKSNGVNLLNTNFYPAYKSQLWIYTQAIGHIQGYTSRYSFILGRNYNYTCKGVKYIGGGCYERLGVIDYLQDDKEYINKTRDAIKWLERVKTYGHTWSEKDILELYPNMCIDSGYWNTHKKAIAEKLGEITQLWYCGVKQRNNAFSRGITSWKDPRCNSDVLGLKNRIGETVDKILNINRQDVVLFSPSTITTEIYNWRNIEREIFVDFETFADIFSNFSDLPDKINTDHIFMIGVYYKNGENWEYKNFISNDCSLEEENRIIKEFIDFIPRKVKIWHWHAEKYLWEKRMDKHSLNWCDMCKIFKEQQIAIKDCFNYRLKNIAECMYKHGLITTKLSSECQSGFVAGLQSWDIIKNGDKQRLKDIIEYNKFDVVVLHDILNCLRCKF